MSDTPISTASFRPRFFRLATINIISNITIPLAGLVDSAFLGHLDDIRFLAGVALATVIFNLVYRTCNFLRMGTTGPTAQACGRQDEEGIVLVLLRNSAIALTLGALILLLQTPLKEIGFSLLSAVPEVKDAGKAYFEMRVLGAPFALLNLVLIGWLLGRERSGQVFVLSAIANSTNIILDYVFISRWGWASAGAGAATAIGQVAMAVVAIALIFGDGWLGKMRSVAGQIFRWSQMMQVFKLNTDIWLRSVAGVATITLFTDLSASFGTEVLATNTLLLQVMIVSFYFIEGMAFATESLAGSFRGEGDERRLVPLVQLSGATSLGIGLSFASLSNVFPRSIFSLLTDHAEIVEQIKAYNLWLLPLLGFSSLAFMLDGYYLGLTESSILRSSVLTASLAVFLPIAIAASQWHNEEFLWLALTSYMAARSIMLALQVPKTIRPEK